MATTDQIKGLFSKEHSALVVLIGLSLWGTWSNHLELIELKIQNAQNLAKIESLINGEKKLSLSAFNRQERQSKPETSFSPDFSSVQYDFNLLASGYRVYQTSRTDDRCCYYVCGS